MDPSRWKTLRAALEELAEVPAPARAAALDRVAGDDDELRAELLRLLPTWDQAPDLQHPDALDTLPSQEIGRRIGAWILERELGSGGMGNVFLARRAEGGFEQRVALKLIRRGLDTDKVLRRFERERALLARLAHPGIAQLFDGGATGEGLPWFAMEHVEGRPIDRYCAENRFGTRERVELVLKVAAAVQHAHAHHVVHRDIKPSNILVDALGAPKLLDFGIAKALQEEDGEEPTLTRTGERLLTPLYASPEQWRGEPATVASDVHALGVVLYELLAGMTPRSRDELEHLAIERDWPAPERPSTRGRRATDTTALGVDTRVVARDTKGDLDLIALKALHTEPARRYATVESFAADLRRWLDGRPIEARADSLAYRARQYVRRNKLAVASAAVVIVGLAVGLVIAIDGWNDAVLANTKATAAQARAQAETSKLLQLAARQDLQDLRDEAETLWPLAPQLLPRLEVWSRKAEQLVRDEPKHKATLQDLDDPHSETAHLDPHESNWWRKQLVAHLADLAALTDPKEGLFVDGSTDKGMGIPRRARVIRDALDRDTPESESARAWDDARTYLRHAPLYAGLPKMPDIFGFVPIGPDPQTGLLELCCTLTGDVPARDEKGMIVLGPTMGIVLVLIPGATTTVGAQVVDPTRENYDPTAVRGSESPTWSVRLDPFLISKYELTQGQWRRMSGERPSSHGSDDESKRAAFDLLPVEMVSWDDCRRVLDRFGLVLPTEIQWEYAARGGTATPWWCGSSTESLALSENLWDEAGAAAWKSSTPPEPWNDGWGYSVPGQRFPSNPFGLHNVLGNVSEWCLDISAPWKLEPSPGRGLRAHNAHTRSIRGGHYRSIAAKARASYRFTASPGQKMDWVGVRPAALIVDDGARWGP